MNIDALLMAEPSPDVARQLVEWADETRNRIVRGDMILGILMPEEAALIPKAYETAAQMGETSAWLTLAWWHANPQIGTSDLEAAETTLETARDSKVTGAGLELVKIRWFYKRDIATADERSQAYQIVADLVETEPENAEAVYFLALLITHGFGIPASPEQGLALQQRAADLGSTDAMFEMYIHHMHGLGTAVDEHAGLQACIRAAEAGHPRAMYNLGAFNATGRGIPKNMAESIKWYERAADAGNPSALVGLAVIYASGDGVETDRAYAEQLLEQADYCGLDVSAVRAQLGL